MGSFYGVSVDRNWGRSTVRLPASLNAHVGELPQYGVTRGNCVLEDVQKVSGTEVVMENRSDVARHSWKIKEQSREAKRVGTENNMQNSVQVIL